ncbi:MAG: polymerase III subunit beta protein [Microgenomates group bacterium GW2011_GWC1_39_7b]|uniref:Beta sliding clamp n=3 Tax=Candidatus Woeseibacteriota TaxID=1752722 RepID=A0A0G0LJV1_9BACT|nr:MAG: polymerase III subunit beta protein [Candidatus Woesebacteria bacterium GW2011_GWB1_39_10]KKR26785.1 MAG: polymerase III subunit beta protein [Microgenomates group bacterium GW2011_GWC1_39_7b]KKR72059.1 MAG: polymerase III subunit beta protein [Candidatus Woesebacteria bacterium GW2011_GWA2_40_7]KKS91133.1 MAG: polymerase III subunit beta protein [Candidatus Woesebacteria bacterium GW2011_GWA1_43_12]
MKLQILQENLDKAINIASRFASTRSQLPILGNILFSCQKTKVIISSTNLEISVAISVGAKVEEEGEISIPAKVISEIVANLPKETIDLESEKEQLKISSPGFTSTVLGMSSSDFPKIPNTIGKEKSIVLPKDDFINALSRVIFASSLDETRPVLTGVLFVFSKDELNLVATDGFRLSQCKVKLPDATENFKLILPKNILLEIVRSSTDSDEITFSFNEKEKQALFGFGNTILVSRLLEGEYPDFEKILPKESKMSVRLDKEELLRAVKLSSVFARDSANIVKFKILKESIKVSAESGSSGSQDTKVDAKIESRDSDLESGGLEIAFNYRFLEDFIHSVKGEEVEIKLSSESAAGVFKDSGEVDYLHLIMPVKVQ